MTETLLPLPPEVWETVPLDSRALIVALQARVRDLEARRGQNSSNWSRPPSSDPSQTPAKAQRTATQSRRKRRGQPGHPGHFRALVVHLEQVDQVVVVAPEVCCHCGQPLPSAGPLRRVRVWRHQVIEVLTLAVKVTEYQMQVRRCPQCGRRTRASLPAGVPLRPFGSRLTAVAAMLSGRYRLGQREVRQALKDLWSVTVSLGAITNPEQAQSAALQSVYAEVGAAVKQAAVVNMDETGWREDKRRAWLWTVVTATLTVFHIDRGRGRAVVEALLGSQFAGAVGSDRWSACSRFAAERRAYAMPT